MSPRLLRPVSISLLLLLLGPAVFAQADDFPVATLITRFPFQQFSGGIMIVRGTIGASKDSLNFILDTGSGGISVDSTTAVHLHLTAVLSDRTIRGIAGIKPVRFIYHQTLNLPGMSVDNLDFHTNDYTILSQVYGVNIDGIIGYSFLRQFIVEINADSMLISVYRPGRFRYPPGGYTLRPDFTTLPITHLMVRDDHRVDADFYFDTGAGLCFLMSRQFVKDSMIMRRGRKLVMTEAEGLGGKTVMGLTVVRTLKLGPYLFHNVPTYILDDEYNVTDYPTLGGLVGNDILRRFNVVINYPFREIHLLPNSHFKDVFDYSYTGLGIYFINGKVLVTDVEDNSPAEEAGIKDGDELFAVDNNFSHNIQTYKNLLQNAGSRIKIIVLREGQPIMINLHIKRIF